MSLTERLEQLVTTIEQRGWTIRPCLQPGIDTQKHISELIKPLGIHIPPSLYELYQWRNGTIESCGPPLFDEHEFLPLEEAILEYQQFVPIALQADPDTRIDYRYCFPFATLMGSQYVIYCNPRPFKGFTYPIIHLFQGDYIRFVNLEVMALTIIEWYKSGAYNMDIVDKNLMDEIWRKLNPNLDPIELL
jgi:hypothetical protein